MKYLYLPFVFTLAFSYSKYIEYSQKKIEITSEKNQISKSRTPASTKNETKSFNLKKWLEQL